MKSLYFLLFLVLTCQSKNKDHKVLEIVPLESKINVETNLNDLTIYKDSTYKVIGINDGDTYEILVNKTNVKIRMNAIDAPERGMPYYKVSKKYLSDLIFNKYIHVDVVKIDNYGRQIANTYVDSLDVSGEMLKAGMAWHFKKYNQSKKYAQLEHEAKENKRGLWQEKKPYAPWEIRKIRRSGKSTKDLFELKLQDQ